MTADDFLKKVKDEKYEFVDFKFTDMKGGWRHITIPAENFTEKTYIDGIGIDGSSIGFLSVKAGDMIIILGHEVVVYPCYGEHLRGQSARTPSARSAVYGSKSGEAIEKAVSQSGILHGTGVRVLPF